MFDQQVIFESTPAPAFEHLGGRRVCYLFLSIGDRQDAVRAQSLADHAGGTTFWVGALVGQSLVRLDMREDAFAR